MSVTRDEVLRIARLAELHVDEEQLDALAQEMSRLVEYVGQIAEVPASENARPFVPGPDQAKCRPDEVRPWPLAFGPGEMAPAFRAGFFLVPRLDAFDAGAGEEEA